MPQFPTYPDDISLPIYGGGSIVQRGLSKWELYAMEILRAIITRKETPPVSQASKVSDSINYTNLLLTALSVDPEDIAFPIYGGGSIVERGMTKEERFALEFLKGMITRKETPPKSKESKVSDAISYTSLLIEALNA